MVYFDRSSMYTATERVFVTVKYIDLYRECSRMVNGFAPSGYGSRENPKKITTTEDKNIFANGS